MVKSRKSKQPALNPGRKRKQTKVEEETAVGSDEEVVYDDESTAASGNADIIYSTDGMSPDVSPIAKAVVPKTPSGLKFYRGAVITDVQTPATIMKKKNQQVLRKLQGDKRQIIDPDTPVDGLRRSARRRLPVLNSHCLERPRYKRDENGDQVLVGVETPIPNKLVNYCSEYFQRLHEKKKDKAKIMKKKRQKFPNTSATNLQPTFGVPVVIDDTEDALIDCVRVSNQMAFSTPVGGPALETDPMIVCKCFKQKTFTSGCVILRPHELKPEQMVQMSTMVFAVMSGTVEVTIHGTVVIMNDYSQFFVPAGNSYSIKNMKDEQAVLSFTQIKHQPL